MSIDKVFESKEGIGRLVWACNDTSAAGSSDQPSRVSSDRSLNIYCFFTKFVPANPIATGECCPLPNSQSICIQPEINMLIGLCLYFHLYSLDIAFPCLNNLRWVCETSLWCHQGNLCFCCSLPHTLFASDAFDALLVWPV